MYTGVPGILVRVFASWFGFKLTIRELPKSVILADRDEVKRTFLAVRSLCTIGGARPCKYTNPLLVSVRMDILTAKGILGAHSSRSSTLISSLSITRRGIWERSKKQRPRNWCYVRMSETWHELTILSMFSNNISNSFIIRLQQWIMNMLSSTCRFLIFDLLINEHIMGYIYILYKCTKQHIVLWYSNWPIRLVNLQWVISYTLRRRSISEPVNQKFVFMCVL